MGFRMFKADNEMLPLEEGATLAAFYRRDNKLTISFRLFLQTLTISTFLTDHFSAKHHEQ